MFENRILRPIFEIRMGNIKGSAMRNSTVSIVYLIIRVIRLEDLVGQCM